MKKRAVCKGREEEMKSNTMKTQTQSSCTSPHLSACDLDLVVLDNVHTPQTLQT